MTDAMLIAQLADDLGWLEGYCRQRPDQAAHAAELRLAAAMVRNCIGPFLDGQSAAPLHVAIVGGAGTGKSTVANFLSGTTVAEANPQAGFTRHPVAYTAENGEHPWHVHPGFLGPLQRLSQPAASNLDEDVFQVRPIAVLNDADFLRRFVIWDCPDMTTWAATGYVSRLLEVAGLADIIVYAASDERYNDEVPTQCLRLLLQAGKPVVVCLMKMAESNMADITAHFQRDVLSRLPASAVACLAIPHLNRAQLADPARLAAPYRIPLINQVNVLGEPATAARHRSVQRATKYLTTAQHRLLGVAQGDLAALQDWRALVQTGQVEFDSRYRREYLTGEKFRRFDEALVRLLDLLELPGAGKVLSQTLWVVRTPYRLLKGIAVKALRRPDTPSLPEQPFLEANLAGWLDFLRKESARRSSSHPVWAHTEKGFASGLTDLVRDRFQQGLRGFRLGLADDVDRTARAMYEELEKNPALLNTARGIKFTVDAGAIAAAVAAGGIGWSDLVLVPLAASISHQLVEFMGKKYVDTQRELARTRQQTLVTQYVSGPLAEWLGQWPTTGGSDYERLHLVLRRLPESIRQLDAIVEAKIPKSEHA